MPAVPIRHLIAHTVLYVACAGCGGSTTSSDPKLSVGGTYTTTVTLGANSNGCTGVTIQQNSTIITHTPGASTLTVTHHGIAYTGTILANATFTTTPKVFPDEVTPLTLSIAGSFTTTAMQATVTVMQGGANPCQYTVTWSGPKVGAPNVIP